MHNRCERVHVTSHTTIYCAANTNMSDELSRSIASALSQAVQRVADEALSRLSSQGVSSTSSSSTSSSTSVSTSRSNSYSQEVRTCVGRQTVFVFLWNLVCYLKVNIWPFSFSCFTVVFVAGSCGLHVVPAAL